MGGVLGGHAFRTCVSAQQKSSLASPTVYISPALKASTDCTASSSIPCLDMVTAMLLPLLCEAVLARLHLVGSHRSVAKGRRKRAGAILTNLRPQEQLDSFLCLFGLAPIGLGRLRPSLNPPKAQPPPRPARRRSRDQKRSHDCLAGLLGGYQ